MTGSERTLRETPERTDRIREPPDALGDAEGRCARLGTAPATPGTPVRIGLPEDGDWIMTRRLRKAVLEAQ